MKTLLIAEKPDAAKKYAAAITSKFERKDGYLESGNLMISWAVGHLIGLAEPDEYDPKYAKWNLVDLPIMPESFRLTPNPKTKKQLKVIESLAKQADLLINGCDCAREGELIFGYIMEYLKIRKPVKRLWTSSLTPEAIQEAYQNMKDGSEYKTLLAAAKARSEADWLIGMNGSRGFSTKYNEHLTVGRVQTPVLAMLYDRQIQVDNFQPEPFFDVEAVFRQGQQSYKGIWQGDRIKEKAKADTISQKIKGKQGSITGYEAKESKESVPKLYNLALLQKEANAKFGFTAKKTLDLAQSLYEKQDAITYPRTSSNYVGPDNIPVIHKVLDRLGSSSYVDIVRESDRSLVNESNKNICRPDKIEDHHAILPTHVIPSGLSLDEKKIYDLVVRRFIAHFYPAARYRIHSLLTEVEGETFKTTVKEILDPGWRVVYPTDFREEEGPAEEEVQKGFSIDPRGSVLCIESETLSKKTTAPKLYTEGTLIGAMETAGKEIEDEELREAIKESGLGTPATRAAIIERLKQVGYAESKGKTIVITQKGKTAIEIFRQSGVAALTSPELTGSMEKKLNHVAKGNGSVNDFMNEIKSFTIDMVVKVREGEQRAAARDFRTTIGACPAPNCSGSIISGKKGFGCSNFRTGCKFVIWKEQFGRTISEKNIQDLLSKGKTSLLKCKNKEGKEYEARFIMKNPATGELGLEFPNQEDNELGSCPVCNDGKIKERESFYGCSKYPDCRFTIPKIKAEKQISKSQVKKLLSSGKTDKIEGFVSKEKATTFAAILILKNGKLEFSFDKPKKKDWKKRKPSILDL